MELTYGLELEWADVDKRITLPATAEWNWLDWTICNSDGHANDPTGQTWVYGSEINTKPTKTIAEQVAIVKELKTLLNPANTFSCALHVHIGLPDKEITTLQQIFRYINKEQKKFLATAWQEHPFDENNFSLPQASKAAKKYHSSLLRRRINVLPQSRVDEILQATTFDEFYNAHAPFSEKTGRRVWHLSARTGINLKSLKKHGTIEFRCFAGSTSPEEIENALLWCDQFVRNALSTHEDWAISYKRLPKKLPRQPVYNDNWFLLYNKFIATQYKGKVDGRSHISE